MGHLSVKIDDELEQRIEQEKGQYPYPITDSDIVRAALDEFLPELEEEGNPKTRTAVTA